MKFFLRSLLTIFVFLNISYNSFSQISFEKVFPGPNDEGAGFVLQTSDTGYIMILDISQTGQFGAWYSLLKTDSFGNEMWLNGTGNLIYAHANNLKSTLDSGYIIVGGGSNDISSSNYDVFLLKTDSLGQQQWIKTYDSLMSNITIFGSHEEGFDVIQTRDGGYLVTGTAGDAVAPELILLKVDSIGNILWLEKDTGIARAYGASIVEAENGNYLAFGSTSITGPDRLMYLLKTDSIGQKIWSRTYPWIYGDYTFGNVVKVNENGEYLLFGSGEYFGHQTGDMLFISTDTAGNVIWEKEYRKYDFATGSGFDITTDGGYVLIGNSTDTSNNDIDIYLVKTDSLGNMMFDTTFGGNNSMEFGISVKQTLDKGYILSGSKDSDAYLLKTDSAANIILETSEIRGNEEIEINIFPNPIISVGFNILFHVNGHSTAQIILYDYMGKEILYFKNESQASGIYNKYIPTESLLSGLYLLRVTINEKIFTKNLVIY